MMLINQQVFTTAPQQ
jgi:hypothetical protein